MTNLISPLLWLNWPFKDVDAWNDFNWVHEQWHRALESVVLTQKSLTVVHFPLDDIRSNTTGHQQMHDALADGFGIPRVKELTTVDFDNRDQFQAWMFTHGLEHQRLRLVGGV